MKEKPTDIEDCTPHIPSLLYTEIEPPLETTVVYKIGDPVLNKPATREQIDELMEEIKEIKILMIEIKEIKDFMEQIAVQRVTEVGLSKWSGTGFIARLLNNPVQI